MDQIREVLFESPGPAVIGLLILAVPLCYLAWRGRGLKRLLPLAPVALAGLLLLTDRVVVTDREKIQALLNRVTEAVVSNRPDDAAACAAEDFEIRASGQPVIDGPPNAALWLRAVLNVYPIRDIDISNLRIYVEANGTASVDFTARTTGTAAVTGGGTTRSRWQLILTRQPDGAWAIRKADLLEVNGHPVQTLPLVGDLPRLF